jgi:hypothetical protein
MSSRRASSADIHDIIAQVAPDVPALLGDDVPHSTGAILAALADRCSKDDVRRTLMRHAVPTSPEAICGC